MVDGLLAEGQVGVHRAVAPVHLDRVREEHFADLECKTALVREERPHEAICKLVEDLDASLVVMSSQGRTGLERYLLGVIPGEMPASRFPMQALGAQAVAARTYALFQILARDTSARIHVYADDPNERFVFINMKKHRESSQLPEGPVVAEITNDGVILEHRGLTFLLPRE